MKDSCLQAERTQLLNSGGSADPQMECRCYDDAIAAAGGIGLQLLGLGLSGHIAFNEPDDHFAKTTRVVELAEETIRANARFFASLEEVPRRAITIGATKTL